MKSSLFYRNLMIIQVIAFVNTFFFNLNKCLLTFFKMSGIVTMMIQFEESLDCGGKENRPAR